MAKFSSDSHYIDRGGYHHHHQPYVCMVDGGWSVDICPNKRKLRNYSSFSSTCEEDPSKTSTYHLPLEHFCCEHHLHSEHNPLRLCTGQQQRKLNPRKKTWSIWGFTYQYFKMRVTCVLTLFIFDTLSSQTEVWSDSGFHRLDIQTVNRTLLLY